MPQRAIVEYPDPRLRERSQEVTEFDASIEALVADLFDTLYATTGIGLSAPQIDDRRRVLVMDLSDNHSEPQVYINPQILHRSVPGIIEESCMSVPGVVGKVFRATQVRVKAMDRAGDPFERNLSNMHAVCLQHEIDHLDGKLFVDKFSWLRRFWLRRATAKAQRASVS